MIRGFLISGRPVPLDGKPEIPLTRAMRQTALFYLSLAPVPIIRIVPG
jgi:hypothetical protein